MLRCNIAAICGVKRDLDEPVYYTPLKCLLYLWILRSRRDPRAATLSRDKYGWRRKFHLSDTGILKSAGKHLCLETIILCMKNAYFVLCGQVLRYLLWTFLRLLLCVQCDSTSKDFLFFDSRSTVQARKNWQTWYQHTLQNLQLRVLPEALHMALIKLHHIRTRWAL